jgi:Na+-transporting NADH:ubiquinone oxidoreductase subunit C
MKNILSMILFILILGSILTFTLVKVDQFTKPMIEENEKKKVISSVLQAFRIEFTDENMTEIYEEQITIKDVQGNQFYFSKSGDVAFMISGSGFQDVINGIIAVKPDLKTILGVMIVGQKETPGLGGRIIETEFLQQFQDKVMLPQILVTSPGKASAENEVNGISGATMTCRAFESILNESAAKYFPLLEEELK